MWNNSEISASDIVFDIMEARGTIKAQQFFTMNRKTKETVFRGSAEYDVMIVEDERVPDDLIISFNPSPDCSTVPEFIKVVDMAESDCSSSVSWAPGKGKLSPVQEYSGNRKERRAAERQRKKAEKRRNKH